MWIPTLNKKQASRLEKARKKYSDEHILNDMTNRVKKLPDRVGDHRLTTHNAYHVFHMMAAMQNGYRVKE